MFGGAVRQIPKGYLPDGFSCARLDMQGGKIPSYDKSLEAIQYLMWAIGILSNFVVGEMVVPQTEAKEEL
jgi:hypothetical protein